MGTLSAAVRQTPTSPPYISALCDSRRPEVDVDIYQAHPVCRSFRAGPSPVLNIGASTGLKYRRPSFLSVESWYLISLPLLPIDMNNQFRPPGNAGFESWRRRQEPISPHRAPSAAEQLLHQVQVNSQPWQRGSYGPPSMDYPRTSLRAPSSLPTHGGTPHACQEENERLKNELQFVIKAYAYPLGPWADSNPTQTPAPNRESLGPGGSAELFENVS